MVNIALISFQLLMQIIVANDVVKRVNATNTSEFSTQGYNLENSLPLGYVKDGSEDYTHYIQLAINKHKNVIFPGFPLMVNDSGIKIGSNKTIHFLKGSELRLRPSFKGTYAILDIKGSDNVTLYNPVIVGDRYTHLGIGGEWGMGISIKGSTNIKIFSPHITNCWGDGIYIGQLYSRVICKNIIIKDAYLKKNRRDGISIIAVDGLLLDNIYAGYTDGTKPMTGINFEPNNPACELKNIRVNNPRTENNGSRGIQVAPKHLLGNSDKTSDITIINHLDIGSPDNAFKMGCNSAPGVKGRLFGTIYIINPRWNRTANNVPLNLSTNQDNYKTIISSPSITNTDGYVLTLKETHDLLIKQRSRANLQIRSKK